MIDDSQLILELLDDALKLKLIGLLEISGVFLGLEGFDVFFGLEGFDHLFDAIDEIN